MRVHESHYAGRVIIIFRYFFGVATQIHVSCTKMPGIGVGVAAEMISLLNRSLGIVK